MTGIIQWFKSSYKMKRWILLILIGIILTCYGLAEILVADEITFQEVAMIAGIFVAGFLSIIIGLIYINKRTLEVLIESTDSRMDDKKNINVKSLIFNKKVYNQGPNIVVIGGGAGLNTVLSGLKNYTDNLTAIVTISEYGEEKTISRKELEVMPLDDVRDSITSLGNADEQITKLLNYKFNKGKLSGLNFSDIYFSAMKDINGNFEDSVIKSNEIFNMVGKVLPVTLDEMRIVAELANGYMIDEKSKIPEIVSEKLTKINRIYIEPSNCRATPGVLDVIKKADCIIIGPGSLYTNVIPNLLVNGVAKSIRESTAIKVYVNNIMTEPGQTDDYSVSDHLNAIIEHCGTGLIDYCIYDTGEIVPEFIKKYNMEGQDLVEQDINKIKGIKFLQRDISVISEDYIRHDPNLVASSVIELICDDLKYQDKQNDPQFMMLNNKLREEKRISKIKRNMAKKAQKEKNTKKGKENKKPKSKFLSKYDERIKSIRESDSKAEKVKKRRAKAKDTRIKKSKITESEPKKTTKKLDGKERAATKTVKKTKTKNDTKKDTKKAQSNVKSSTVKKKTSEEIRKEMIDMLNKTK